MENRARILGSNLEARLQFLLAQIGSPEYFISPPETASQQDPKKGTKVSRKLYGNSVDLTLPGESHSSTLKSTPFVSSSLHSAEAGSGDSGKSSRENHLDNSTGYLY